MTMPKGKIAPHFWWTATTAERLAISLAEGAEVKDLCFDEEAGMAYVAATVGASSSTWTALAAATPNLQAVTDVDNDSTNVLGFGSGNSTTAVWHIYGDASSVILRKVATNFYGFKSTAAGFYSMAADRALGGPTSYPWGRLYANHRAMGVLNVGDASSALDDEEFVRVTEPAAGANTLTLPAAVVGYTYTIEVTSGAGTVDIATTGGDTINGAASPLSAIGPGWHQVIAQTAADWRYAQLA